MKCDCCTAFTSQQERESSLIFQNINKGEFVARRRKKGTKTQSKETDTDKV